jgi:hypothetical protein
MSNFQNENWTWIIECFGEDFARSQAERGLRFLEEALELCQASGMPKAHALRLIDYVYDRPALNGDIYGTAAELLHALAML